MIGDTDFRPVGRRPFRQTLPLLALFAMSVGCDAIGPPLPASPPLPVVVTLRDSLVGEGQVAIFSNQTPNRLTIRVVLNNAAVNDRKEGNLDLDPNGTAEIGWLEGWTFVSGETITISHGDYRSQTYHVP